LTFKRPTHYSGDSKSSTQLFPSRRTNVRDATAGQKLNRIVDETKPEVVYFTEQHGQRGAIMIVEMSDPSKIPTLAEPWFLTFNASVEFRVVMTPDDLQKAGLDEVGKKWA